LELFGQVEPSLSAIAGVGRGQHLLAGLEPFEHFDEFGVAAAEPDLRLMALPPSGVTTKIQAPPVSL
jgi:hypothetical protein